MPIEFKDYYATLGVERDATSDAIKQAFRKLARKFHPDVAKDRKTAEEKFKEINEANEVLSDPDERRKYNDLAAGWQDGVDAPPRSAWQSTETRDGAEPAHEFHFGGTGFSDFFEQYFGSAAHAGSTGSGGRFGAQAHSPNSPQRG